MGDVRLPALVEVVPGSAPSWEQPVSLLARVASGFGQALKREQAVDERVLACRQSRNGGLERCQRSLELPAMGPARALEEPGRSPIAAARWGSKP